MPTLEEEFTAVRQQVVLKRIKEFYTRECMEANKEACMLLPINQVCEEVNNIVTEQIRQDINNNSIDSIYELLYNAEYNAEYTI